MINSIRQWWRFQMWLRRWGACPAKRRQFLWCTADRALRRCTPGDDNYSWAFHSLFMMSGDGQAPCPSCTALTAPAAEQRAHLRSLLHQEGLL